MEQKCFHCGDSCDKTAIHHQDKIFCCQGCVTVFDILNDNELTYYYQLEESPGISPKFSEHKYAYLDSEEIASKLVEFSEEGVEVVSFTIPSMHCSSCIWVLEHIHKLEPRIKKAFVNFPKKKVRITYNSDEISLREVVEWLVRLGYEPNISLESIEEKKSHVDRSIIYKLGIAGFAFGNIMSLTISDYFNYQDFWLDQFRPIFRYLMFIFSLPVVFYSASDYFKDAYSGLKNRMLNIDFPLALGIAALFLRSTYEVFFDKGLGFFDSLAGLVFFLLLGKFFQQKTYSFLSFERDYKSYFPIAVTLLNRKDDVVVEEQLPVYKIAKGDRILLRNEELLPADAVLIKGEANIDYSFVTGESHPVRKKSGDKIFAGGRQKGGVLELEILKPVEQSYLTQLWSDDAFAKNPQRDNFQNLTDSISQRFTIAILLIAFLSTAFWLFYDPSKAMNVFTAVLIIACPCAIALSAPFTLGSLLRIYGKNELYIKDSEVIERMAKVDVIVFDKTGTITSSNESNIKYVGKELPAELEPVVAAVFRGSNHPLSRAIYESLSVTDLIALDEFEELTGKGMKASYGTDELMIGSASFVGAQTEEIELNQTRVYIKVNDKIYGWYVFTNVYREGVEELFEQLGSDYELILLSGDNDGELQFLKEFLPEQVSLNFNQSPSDKLAYIKQLQADGKTVMMVGDGLNDSGALAQSDVGIVIAENVNVFSPACDAIMAAPKLVSLNKYIDLSKRGIKIIKWSFLFSLFYNIIGTSFAVSGNLAPVVAAILMPLSSISIVSFTTLASNLSGKILNRA